MHAPVRVDQPDGKSTTLAPRSLRRCLSSSFRARGRIACRLRRACAATHPGISVRRRLVSVLVNPQSSRTRVIAASVEAQEGMQ